MQQILYGDRHEKAAAIAEKLRLGRNAATHLSKPPLDKIGTNTRKLRAMKRDSNQNLSLNHSMVHRMRKANTMIQEDEAAGRKVDFERSDPIEAMSSALSGVRKEGNLASKQDRDRFRSLKMSHYFKRSAT